MPDNTDSGTDSTPKDSGAPKDAGQAMEWSMARLRAAVLFRRNNPNVEEWERINDRNNFARGIAEAMKRKPA
jgi:hypothetical protein